MERRKESDTDKRTQVEDVLMTVTKKKWARRGIMNRNDSGWTKRIM